MKENYGLLKKIEARPSMWTGELSLKSIRTFIDGYSFALHEHKMIDLDEDNEENFHDWLAKKLGFYESTAGWQNMILAVTIDLDPKNIKWDNYDSSVTKEQHENTIRKFYELLEEFVKEHTIIANKPKPH
ncbi:hypothetical protein [uncultured Roseivirga sp.]|uniref:hypothetical protein n=1 Tax=uncultured Roseivirga sp. TaxID=543088 RepID=UPI00258B2A1A|nr:hypothetical protein [uncultured Roseivirga sp.]